MIESKSGRVRFSAPAHPSATGGRVSGLVFSRVLHDSTPPFVGPSVRGHTLLFLFFAVFGLTVPAQMIK